MPLSRSLPANRNGPRSRRNSAAIEVSAFSATTALQDPHYIEARPSLIARVRNADLVVCAGADLEAGWLPLLLRSAGNPRGATGNAGLLSYRRARDATRRTGETPRSRARRYPCRRQSASAHRPAQHRARGASACTTPCRSSIRRSRAHYRRAIDDFAPAGAGAPALGAQSRTAPKDMAVVSQHQGGWTYLIRWLGLREVTVLEPKPGVPRERGASGAGARAPEIATRENGITRRLSRRQTVRVACATNRDPRRGVAVHGRRQ